MTADEIQRKIEGSLQQSLVQVRDTTGTGDHFEAIVVSGAFSGKTMIEQHRMIYSILGPAMSGPIHALALRTFTPEQWDKVGASKT
jgi:stress-induced morphogen